MLIVLKLMSHMCCLDVRTHQWSEEAVRDLIHVWGEVSSTSKTKRPWMKLQKGFAGRRKCKEISNTLCKLGRHVTASQCRFKLFQLIKQYRMVCSIEIILNL